MSQAFRNAPQQFPRKQKQTQKTVQQEQDGTAQGEKIQYTAEESPDQHKDTQFAASGIKSVQKQRQQQGQAEQHIGRDGQPVPTAAQCPQEVIKDTQSRTQSDTADQLCQLQRYRQFHQPNRRRRKPPSRREE